MQSRTTSPLERARIGLQHRALLWLIALAQKARRGKPRAAHLITGERGELEALFFLRRQGYVIIERRWRSREFNGDLDLIAWEGDTLCFVEVKARTRRDLTPAASAIGYGKKQMLRRMAGSYKRTLPAADRYNTLSRFDVVSVYLLDSLLDGGSECELVRGAFEPQESAFRQTGV